MASVTEAPFRGAKVATAILLNELTPTGNDKDDKAIQKAIEAIDKSLSPDQWLDDSHLSSKGKKVFDEEKKAVNELQKVRADRCIRRD